MEVAITKMSKNGQVVIPAEIRTDAGLKPFTKFLVFNQRGNILLKAIKKEELLEDMELRARIERSERQINEGNVIKADTALRDEAIDELLMKS